MEFYLVEFASTKNDPVRIYLLDEKKHDDWCMSDSGGEAHYHFKTIWHGTIEQIIFSEAYYGNKMKEIIFSTKW